jgi:hypothetical protein
VIALISVADISGGKNEVLVPAPYYQMHSHPAIIFIKKTEKKRTQPALGFCLRNQQVVSRLRAEQMVLLCFFLNNRKSLLSNVQRVTSVAPSNKASITLRLNVENGF